ncbi:MAG: class I SAM-dependent methyltransferase [Terriglobales bacterium]
MSFFRRFATALPYALARAYLRRQYRLQESDRRGPNERPLEYSFALQALALSAYQDLLDVGPGQSPWPALVSGCGYHVTAMDEVLNYWGRPVLNPHFYVLHQDITKPELDRKFGIITCLSTLEHIPRHADAVSAMADLLKPGGILVLTFPYNERRYVPNVYALPEANYGQQAPYVCQVFGRNTVEEWISSTGLELCQQRYFQVFSGEMWAFGSRLRPMKEVAVDEPHHLAGIVLRRPQPTR